MWCEIGNTLAYTGSNLGHYNNTHIAINSQSRTFDLSAQDIISTSWDKWLVYNVVYSN